MVTDARGRKTWKVGVHMRYDTQVFFRRFVKDTYNPDTGDYIESPPIEVMRYASVTDTGTETLNLIYGNIKQGSKTIRLQRGYVEPFNEVRIGEKTYRVDFSRWNKVFVVSEVQ